MKAINVHVGDVYAVKVSGKIADVKIVSVHPSGGWNGVNVATKRDVRLRTAARLRYNVTLKTRVDEYHADLAAGRTPVVPTRNAIAGDYDGTKYGSTVGPIKKTTGWY
jgi:hypothetical protein